MPKEAVGGFGHTVIRSPVSSPTHTLTPTTESAAHYTISRVLSDSEAFDIQGSRLCLICACGSGPFLHTSRGSRPIIPDYEHNIM